MTRSRDQTLLGPVVKNALQEIQGLYGPFTLSERVVQKIWLRGDFDQKDLKCESGRSLKILAPGRWNHLEGADFLDARLEIGGQSIVGDVEVHFRAADWFTHAHETNSNFNRVCLHVILYPDDSRQAVVTASGNSPESLCLMPRLERDLEDYMIDDALIEMEQVQETEWMRAFFDLPLDARRDRIQQGSQERWRRKVDFAKKRLLRHAWDATCHQYCMEVLGYSRNRSPMSRLSLEYSIDDFASGRANPVTLFEQEVGEWRLNGLRPANHPRNRLVQYASLCQERPDWPGRLKAFLEKIGPVTDLDSTSLFRRKHGVNRLCSAIADDVFGGCIGAKRLNTLICDALFPLAMAAGIRDLEAYWRHWPAGDAPDQIHRFLKQADLISREDPFSNGQVQGSLQIILKR